MGCCVSKTDGDQAAASAEEIDKTLPPSEEEKVKEVLSETPNPRRSVNVDDIEDIQHLKKKNEIISADLETLTKNRVSYFDVERSEDLSEVSGATTSTATFGDTGDKDSEVTMMPRSSSPAAVKYRKKRSVSGELGTCRRGRCAAARGRGSGGGSLKASPSPGRRRPDNGVVGGGVGRTVSEREATALTGCGFAGDRLSRRSVSPAWKRGMAAEQKHPGMQYRVNGRASRAVVPPAYGGKFGGEEHSIGCGEKVENEESLENPLVSLECFIFL